MAREYLQLSISDEDLATRLTNGTTLTELAHELGINYNTIRNHAVRGGYKSTSLTAGKSVSNKSISKESYSRLLMQKEPPAWLDCGVKDSVNRWAYVFRKKYSELFAQSYDHYCSCGEITIKGNCLADKAW